MLKSGQRFSLSLRKAIDVIAFRETKNRQSIHDELGYALGRHGGSAIAYWIYRQRVPARLNDVEELARLLAHRNGWQERDELRVFLESAAYPDVEALSNQIFPVGDPLSFTTAKLSDPGVYSHSPFIAGPPIINPRHFFGRTRELTRIFNALSGITLQHVALSGVQRSGKTSLLHYIRNITCTSPALLRPGQFCNWLPHPQNYRWVFVDFQDPRVSTREGLLRFILSSLKYPLPNPCTLTRFIDTMCANLQNPTVILMEEVQAALASPEFDQEFWWGFRSLATNLTGGRLGFVLVSQKPPSELVMADGNPSPFFNIFGQVLKLAAFTEDEARQLIASSPLPFPDDDVEWIIVASGCWPSLLQILCQTCLTAIEEGHEDDSWRAEGLRNIAPYRHLLQAK